MLIGKLRRAVLAALAAALSMLCLGAISAPSAAQAATTATQVASAASAPSPYNCGNTTGNVQLSFDDGASQAQLNTILAVLKAKNVKATFFFTPATTPANQFRQIAAAGHYIGNHTYSHPQLTLLGDDQVRRQLSLGRPAAANTSLVRPPFGATNARVNSIITSMGYRLCLWTVDSRDWDSLNTRSAAQLTNRVLYGDRWTPPARPGGMVLMHGTGRYTAAALPGIIDGLRGQGLRLPPLR